MVYFYGIFHVHLPLDDIHLLLILCHDFFISDSATTGEIHISMFMFVSVLGSRIQDGAI